MTFRTKRVPFRPGPLKDQGSLLLAGFDLDKAHARPGHRLTDRVGIRGIVLLTFHVGFYVPGRHQSHAVPQLPVLSPNGGRPRRLPSRPGKVPASRRTPAACPALADVERQPRLQHQRRVPEKLTSQGPNQLSPQTPWLSSILPTPTGWPVGGEPSTASKADICPEFPKVRFAPMAGIQDACGRRHSFRKFPARAWYSDSRWIRRLTP
jgi:hypothetical protein